MKLQDLRQRLSSANFINSTAPVLLGAALLFNSSCANVRKFAHKSETSPKATPQVAQEDSVQHAYTAAKPSQDFVDLLEHKMKGTNLEPKSAQPKQVASESAVEGLVATGKDPFISEALPEEITQPEKMPVVQPKQVANAAKPSQVKPRVIDLASVTHDAPQPSQSSLPESDWTKAAPGDELLADDSQPRPFVPVKEEALVNNSSGDSETDKTKLPLTEAEPTVAEAQPVVTEETSDNFASAEPDADEQPIPEATQIPSGLASTDTEEEAKATNELLSNPFVEHKVELGRSIQLGGEIVQAAGASRSEFSPNSGITQVSGEIISCPPAGACPPEIGLPASNPAACPPMVAQSAAYPAPEISGDEYIFDGGDAGTKVYYNDYSRFGLDVEDTIAEYSDDMGVAHVKPSTRASIYAPKFAAVRSATLPHTDVKIVKLAGHQDQRMLAGIDTKLVIDEKTRHDEAVGMRMRSRPSGVEGNSVDTVLHQNVAADQHVKLLNVYEEIRYFREGRINRLNSAIIGDAIAAAADWNGDLGVQIYARDLAGQEVQGRYTSQDYTAVEDRSTPGDLTVVKAVDKKVAKPGDILTFTIRIDNTGDRFLQKVRIVDNLSPRLVYVEGSVDSDLNGKLDTEDNGRGSQILTFSFEGALKGHSGGWVSFKCKVR